MAGSKVLLSLIGGIVLLLWGIRLVRTGVLRGFGSEVRSAIAGATRNRWFAAGTGAFVGMVLQSSTATALIVCSFVAQGAMGLTAGLATMLGADLGSSIAAQIFATGIGGLWPLLAFVGFLLFSAFEGRSSRWHYAGRILLGLGFTLLALQLISASAADIRSSPTVQTLLVSTSDDIFLSILIGALVTWIMSSSLAAILLIASLAAAGLADPESFLPLVLGVNLGAALPAITATLTEPPSARRVPLGNLVFRLLGVVLAALLLPFAPRVLQMISTDPVQQIINAHLIFNFGLSFSLLFAVTPVAWLVTRLIPDRPQIDDEWAPRNLDVSLTATPSVALGMAARETLRMGDLVEKMLERTMTAFQHDDANLRDEIVSADDNVDRLHEAVKLYLTRLSREELTLTDSQRCVDIITFTTNLEHVGDIVEKNLMDLADKKARGNLQFSAQGLKEISDMHRAMMSTMHLALSVFMSQSLEDAKSLIARKNQFRELEFSGTERHFERLRSGQAASIQTSSLHLDILRDFKRINSHLTSVAYPILERAGALRTSRLK